MVVGSQWWCRIGSGRGGDGGQWWWQTIVDMKVDVVVVEEV